MPPVKLQSRPPYVQTHPTRINTATLSIVPNCKHQLNINLNYNIIFIWNTFLNYVWIMSVINNVHKHPGFALFEVIIWT